MLKKTMTYPDIDGKMVTENFYFNMTKAELLKLELSDEEEGFASKIQRIAEQGDDVKGREVIEIFDSILRQSYGIRKDGKFIKPAGAFEEFMTTEAYSDLLFEITTDAKKSAEFANGLLPSDLLAEVEKEASAQKMLKGQSASVVLLDEISMTGTTNPEEMTDKELLEQLGANPEETRTDGYTDLEIQHLTPAELATKSRSVLLRAYQLKNQK
jgi:hypothetical protein